MKSMIRLAAALMLAGTMAGCTVTTTVTETSTSTTTDTDGKTTTTTTTTVTENGKTTTTTETITSGVEDEEDVIKATLTIDNETGMEFTGMYFVPSDREDWGDNLLDEGEVFADDTYISFINGLSYNDTALMWDLRVELDGGLFAEFEGIDLSASGDPENIEILLTA